MSDPFALRAVIDAWITKDNEVYFRADHVIAALRGVADFCRDRFDELPEELDHDEMLEAVAFDAIATMFSDEADSLACLSMDFLFDEEVIPCPVADTESRPTRQPPPDPAP